MDFDALPLLTYKVAPCIYDLSTGLHYVSIRDQMLRGFILGNALIDAANAGATKSSALIIGAGVAGVSCALTLSKAGWNVHLQDASKNAPFVLQRSSNARFVGPFIYEWPLCFFEDQRYPPRQGILSPFSNSSLPYLCFDHVAPVSAASLIPVWEDILRGELKSSSNFTFKAKASASVSLRYIRAWREDRRRSIPAVGRTWAGRVRTSFKASNIVLAAGMGPERPCASGTSAFWSDDSLLRLNCGEVAPPCVTVSGGGDGALQDFLRAATGREHPLLLWDSLVAATKNGGMSLEKALGEVIALEHQHALAMIWSSDIAREYETLDGAYSNICSDLAADPKVSVVVQSWRRHDVSAVRLVVRERYIGKAYALNRFLVHLMDKVFANAKSQYARVALGVPSGTMPLAGLPSVVIERHGINAQEAPAKLLGVTKISETRRGMFSRIPLPLCL
jgi:hypothetical protein